MKRLPQTIACLFLLPSLQSCIVSSAIGVVAETVEAGVEITGAVIGTTVDIIIPDGDDKEKEEER